jgi:hypothetical protein
MMAEYFLYMISTFNHFPETRKIQKLWAPSAYEDGRETMKPNDNETKRQLGIDNANAHVHCKQHYRVQQNTAQ